MIQLPRCPLTVKSTRKNPRCYRTSSFSPSRAMDEDDTRQYRMAALHLAAANYRLNWWRNAAIASVAFLSLANLVVNIVGVALS